MGGQVAEGHAAGHPGIGAGRGQVDDDLGRHARQRHGFAGLVAPGDDHLDLGDAVIVAGGVVQPQRVALGLRRRLGKGDQRGLVLDHLEGPAGDFLAVLHHRKAVAAGDLSGGAIGALADDIELDGGIAEAKFGCPAAALDLGQHLAALRHFQRLGMGIDGGEKYRGLIGIGGRRHPDIEARRHRGHRRGKARMEGALETVGGVAPAGGKADGEQQHDDAAQGKGIAPGKARGGQAETQPAKLFLQAPAMQLPELGRARIGAAAGQLVFQRLQRAMLELVDDLDAPAGGRLIGQLQAAQSPPQKEEESRRQQNENADVNVALNERERVEQGQGREQSKHAEGRPQRGPGLLPQQAQANRQQPLPGHRNRATVLQLAAQVSPGNGVYQVGLLAACP